jgi:hypothetical protein
VCSVATHAIKAITADKIRPKAVSANRVVTEIKIFRSLVDSWSVVALLGGGGGELKESNRNPTGLRHGIPGSFCEVVT